MRIIEPAAIMIADTDKEYIKIDLIYQHYKVERCKSVCPAVRVKPKILLTTGPIGLCFQENI